MSEISVLESYERIQRSKDPTQKALLNKKLEQKAKELASAEDDLALRSKLPANKAPKAISDYIINTMKSTNKCHLRPLRIITPPPVCVLQLLLSFLHLFNTDKIVEKRVANVFIKKTFERDEQLLKIYRKLTFPQEDETGERVGIMIMLAGSGCGKTHMIDTIPRSLSIVDEDIQRLQDILAALNSSDESTETIQYIRAKIRELEEIKTFVQKKVIFLPITFNNRTEYEPDLEASYSPEVLLISRVLFTYFSTLPTTFTVFCQTFHSLIKSITLREAVECIRFDQMNGGDTDLERDNRKTEDSRVLLMVDEIAKVGDINKQKGLYSAIKQNFLCLCHS